MSEDEEINREVHDFFKKHIESNRVLDDIKGLDALPGDPRVLRRLGERCLREARKALRAGHHTESRRLGILAGQLQKRAEQIDQRKPS
jgi:hypothetical protein